MQTGSRTLIGVFSDITDAKRATDELRALGISQVRLVENDQDVSFTGTAERQGASTTGNYGSQVEYKKTGIGAFFSRLFGFDDSQDRSNWSMNHDSEAYFQEAYDRKHHLVVVEDCNDPTVCREVITRFGGAIEERGGQFYETERYRDRDLTSNSPSMELDRESTLTNTRGDFSADSSLARIDRDADRQQTLSGSRLDSNLDNNLDSERVMELREEQLDVHTERMQTGEVQLRKEIITETKTVDIPVTREEIVVERRPLQGAAREGSLETADLDADTNEIRIPVSEEFVHIDKKVVPREEVRVSKEKITDTKTVSEDVRREEAQLDSDGKVVITERGTGRRGPLTSTRGSDSIQPGV